MKSCKNEIILKNSLRKVHKLLYILKLGSMSKTLKFEAKTPKKYLLKNTMTKTRKSDFFLLKTYFPPFYSYFSPYIICKYNFLSIYF